MKKDCVTLKAYAKINLSLDIVGRRDDGYHMLRSVMQSISLYDEVKVTLYSTPQIKIICDKAEIPTDESNTAYKAAKIMLSYIKSDACGCEIKIKKNIPSQAGLGGGSSDAAAVIIALNELLDLNLSNDELVKVGAQIGADVPFFIYGGTCLCEGIGEKIRVLPKIQESYAVIVKPDFGISTPLAYKNFDSKNITSYNTTDPLVKAISSGVEYSKFISNDLEAACDNHKIYEIKEKLMTLGADCAQMSGSGSAVFGLFAVKENALTALNALKSEFENVFLCETVNNCNLCPRKCDADRCKSVGFCAQSDEIKIARADIHLWEEPCISGTRGSGTVFFSGCTLKCAFCQNYEISQLGKGYKITCDELSDIFLELQEKGAHNINLVSPTPYVNSIINALEKIKGKLKIPVVYNCGGYESIDTIRMLDGYVDIYLPDLKYFSSELSARLSKCGDYFERAIEAIIEMQKQVGKPKFDDDGMMRSGVIVRHLVLPNHRDDSIKVLDSLAARFSKDDILISLMSQYVPMHKAFEFGDISRRISTFEYNKVLEHLDSLGFDGFSQERDSASTVYTPEFFDSKQ